MAEIKPRLLAPPRKREELPFPDLPHTHEHNKLQQVLSVRVDRNLKKRFEAWVAAHNLSKHQGMEYAIELLLENPPPIPAPPGLR